LGEKISRLLCGKYSPELLSEPEVLLFEHVGRVMADCTAAGSDLRNTLVSCVESFLEAVAALLVVLTSFIQLS
jgi:hypothetical protein